MTQEDELLINYVKNNIGELINIIDNRSKDFTCIDYSDLRICGFTIRDTQRSIIVGLPHKGGWKHISGGDMILKEYISYGYINEQYIFTNTITLS